MNEEYRLFLYPFDVRQVTLITESYADELDRPNSFMYDEYPDREYLNLILDILHNRLYSFLAPSDNEAYLQMCRIADAAFINQIYLKRAYML